MFKKKILLFLLVLFPLITFSQPEPTETTLPLKFNTGNRAPYGMASTVISIQGKKIPVILDTGAKKYGLVLSKKALQKLYLRFTGKQVCSIAVDGKHCEAEFIIPEVQIGAFTLKNVKGAVLTKLWGGNDDGFRKTEASQNGLIGFSFLSQFNLLLDYPHRRLVLVKHGAILTRYSLNQWTKIPFSGHLLTQLMFNNKRMLLSWDTGAAPSVVRTTYAAQFKVTTCPSKAYAPSKCRSIQSTSLSNSAGQKLPNNWFMLIDSLPNRSVAPFDGLVGTNFYTNNLVYYDFYQHTIYVAPPEISAAHPVVRFMTNFFSNFKK